MKRWMVWSVVGLVVFLGGPACTRTEDETPEEPAAGREVESLPCESDTVIIAIGPRSFGYPEKDTNPIPGVCLRQPFDLEVSVEEGVNSFRLGNYRLVKYDIDTGRWEPTPWPVTIGMVDDPQYRVEGRGDTAVFAVPAGGLTAERFSFQIDTPDDSWEDLRDQILADRHLLLFKVTIEDEHGGLTTFDPPWDPKGRR